MTTQTAYQKKLLDPRWQKKRLKILQRDKWRCRFCEDETSTPHVHHKVYGETPWEVDNKDLITVCESCHSIIEYEKPDEVLHIDLNECWYTVVKKSEEGRFHLVYFKKTTKSFERLIGISYECLKDDIRVLEKFRKKYDGLPF